MKIPISDMERLEQILMNLDRIPKERMNIILEDMVWLAGKLREAYLMLEGEDDFR